MSKQLAVYGVGNALVDMEYRVEDSLLTAQNIEKSLMTLIDAVRLQQLSQALSAYPHTPYSGGSAANTIYAVQALGQPAGYACRVGADEVGNFFLQAMRDAGVHIAGQCQTDEDPTGRCIVAITPDGERSMSTFLGNSTGLDSSALDPDAIRSSRCIYIEGYLSSAPSSTEVACQTKELALEAGVTTSITLSDPSMVAAFKDNFTKIIGNGVDQLFCNLEEALAWANTDRLDIATTELLDLAKTANITLGAKGSLVATDQKRTEVAGFATTAVDTTGAGDIYAGAVLFGRCSGWDPETSARFANFAASTLVSQFGARFPTVAAYRQLLDEFKH